MSNGIIISFNECCTIEHLVTNDKDFISVITLTFFITTALSYFVHCI